HGQLVSLLVYDQITKTVNLRHTHAFLLLNTQNSLLISSSPYHSQLTTHRSPLIPRQSIHIMPEDDCLAFGILNKVSKSLKIISSLF
ncbi:MAG: hypothetical protein R6U55_06415, partial [Desulfovermiculus sp.]